MLVPVAFSLKLTKAEKPFIAGGPWVCRVRVENDRLSLTSWIVTILSPDITCYLLTLLPSHYPRFSFFAFLSIASYTYYRKPDTINEPASELEGYLELEEETLRHIEGKVYVVGAKEYRLNRLVGESMNVSYNQRRAVFWATRASDSLEAIIKFFIECSSRIFPISFEKQRFKTC